jgi:predicted NUDIX family NTP pyrophosphohydrolase
MKISAGLLMFKKVDGILKVFLVHPGGPFWVNKDAGAWSVPKGEMKEDEHNPFDVAIREFTEETGFPTTGPYFPLGNIYQKSGKTVFAWAFEGDNDPSLMKCNMIEINYPPKSENVIAIPEVDRGEYFDIEEAKKKINVSQVKFLERLQTELERLSL